MKGFNKELFSELLTKAMGEGKSLNQFAAECGVSAAHISRLIRKMKDVPPSPSILRKLAKGEVSYNDLMAAAGYYELDHEGNALLYKQDDGKLNDIRYVKPYLTYILSKMEEEHPGTINTLAGSEVNNIKDFPFEKILKYVSIKKNGDIAFSIDGIEKIPHFSHQAIIEKEKNGKTYLKDYQPPQNDPSVENDMFNLLKIAVPLVTADPELFTQLCRAKDLPESERQKIKDYAAYILEKHLKENK